ncbi:kinase-associated lipoprotein B [Paenibacillus abyssi]|uniref:Kinase-associated lipoprotein B n=1 Tax=Paenibacillus abyssi TaxID=1340531 RepID=A0A917LGU4_9BACL|nr:kinase-associated lipoprotein B [Paenibacillus abyssi]GGG21805.1 kinase-associated lipoprotein B [Paenibacillus abyssi]
MQNHPENVIQAGELVKMTYKSGVYIGEMMEMSGPRAVVKVLAVIKHPEQGDLHNPYDPDVPMFHERRALSYTEKALAPLRDLEPYAGEVPDYRESLQHALHREMAMLDKLKRWAERGLTQLEQLQKEYK